MPASCGKTPDVQFRLPERDAAPDAGVVGGVWSGGAGDGGQGVAQAGVVAGRGDEVDAVAAEAECRVGRGVRHVREENMGVWNRGGASGETWVSEMGV